MRANRYETALSISVNVIIFNSGQPIDDTANSVKTKDLHFTIVPVNSRPPRVALGHRVFRCSEGGNAVISQNFLMADDDDTPMDQLRKIIGQSL